MSSGWGSGEQDTIVDALYRGLEERPDKPYIDFQGDGYTVRDIVERSARLAHGLKALGVKAGDTVTCMQDNNLEAVLVWFATNMLGAISVPVNTAYKGEFLRHQIVDSGARVLIAESDYAERMLDLAADLPEVELLLYRGDEPKGDGLKTMPLADAFTDDTSRPDVTIKPRDLSMLIYTAGTTGPSKGCMISHNYALNLSRQSVRGRALTADDINWTALPLFHLNARSSSILSALISGGSVSIYPRFSLSNFWPEVERSKATTVNLLGSMIPLIAEAPDNEASQRCFGQIRVVAGAPFPAQLQQKWLDRFGVGRCGSNGYGLSEAALVTSLSAGEYAAPGSSGKRNDDFDVRIVDDEDNELPAGQAGEIIIRPKRPHVMFEGYWRRPEATMTTMRNMWFHSGDIGKFDEDGFFYFVDRKKDYLRRRGENISSFEMETTFRKHPEIEDVAVHAVPSELTEDDVKVTAIRKAGSTLTEEDLCRWSVDNLPYFSVPRYIEFRDELPRNPVGRVLKYQLRDDGCTPATWDREKSGIELVKR